MLPSAFMLYRGFETAPVTARDLLRFGLAGTSRDLLRVVIMGLLGGLLGLALPLIFSPLFNDVLPRGEVNTLGTVVLALAMAALGGSAFRNWFETSHCCASRDAWKGVLFRLPFGIGCCGWLRVFSTKYETGDLADQSVEPDHDPLGPYTGDQWFDSGCDFFCPLVRSDVLVQLAAGAGCAGAGPDRSGPSDGSVDGVADSATARIDAGHGPRRWTHLPAAHRGGQAAGCGRRGACIWTLGQHPGAKQKEYAYRARRIAAAQHTLTQAFPGLTSVALYLAMIELGGADRRRRKACTLADPGRVHGV